MKIKEKQFKKIRYIICVVILLLALLGIKTGFDIDEIEKILESNNILETDSLNVDDDKYNSNISKDKYKVIRVVDGDTIQIEYNNQKEKVRMIGIDTPESVHPNESKNTEEGRKSSEYTKKMLEGEYVNLELDVQERDKYGRILAYVYLDGIMFNKTLLKEGYAKIATYPPNVKYVDEFQEIQTNARKNKVGIWK